MSSNFKSVPAAHVVPVRAGNLYRLAIVGAGTLKGKEVAEVLSDRNFPSLDIKLLDDDDSLGKLESVGDEVIVYSECADGAIRKDRFHFLRCRPGLHPQELEKGAKCGQRHCGPLLCFGRRTRRGCESRPGFERQLGQALTPELQPGPAVVAHPAAVVLALLLLRLQKAGGLKRVAATVFEPASEHGQKGMDELHEQTVNLLSFQHLPKKIFDAQIAFNMVARYGEQSVPALAAVERRVLKHYQRIAGKDAPLLSLLLVQAPIFHGHAFALHMEMEKLVDDRRHLQGSGRGARERYGFSGGVSQQRECGWTGRICWSRSTPDVSDLPNGSGCGRRADNLRIAATTAVECAENMAASPPRGKDSMTGSSASSPAERAPSPAKAGSATLVFRAEAIVFQSWYQ